MEKHGTTFGYEPQYRKLFEENKWGEWRMVPIKRMRFPSYEGAVPYPYFDGDLISVAYLYGYEQAQALAWGFAAGVAADAENILQKIEVRVIKYKINFSIATEKVEGEPQEAKP